MKYAWIENNRDKYTVSRLCRVLSVSRTGYCQRRVRAPSARALTNAALDAQVVSIDRDNRKSYGRPRITQQLRQQDQCVSAERGAPKSHAPGLASGLSARVRRDQRFGSPPAGGGQHFGSALRWLGAESGVGGWQT